MIEAPRFATLYEHKGVHFLGRWWPTRDQLDDARLHELSAEPETRAVATIVGRKK